MPADDFLKRVIAQRELEQQQRLEGKPREVPALRDVIGASGINRQVKVSCGCGYIARTTKKWLKTYGPPLCPNPACAAKAMHEG